MQLCLYDIAVRHSPKFRGLRPVKLTLEMLEHERPKEYVIEDDIIMPASKRGKSMSLEEKSCMIINTGMTVTRKNATGALTGFTAHNLYKEIVPVTTD